MVDIGWLDDWEQSTAPLRRVLADMERRMEPTRRAPSNGGGWPSGQVCGAVHKILCAGGSWTT